MQTLPFTLRQLAIFSSLAETLSFRRSAESLGISQVSVSNQMKVLEEQLGVRLLARSPGKRPRLTGEGLAFIEDLQAFHAAAEKLSGHRRREMRVQPVKYQVLIGHGLLDNYVRQRMPSFMVDNPRIELVFTSRHPYRTLQTPVDLDKYDFALFSMLASNAIGPGLRSIALLHGGIFGHRRFAEGRQLPLSSDVISALPFILPSSDIGGHEVRESLARDGIHLRNVVAHTQHYDVLVSMLSSGSAVASFTDAMLPAHVRGDVVMMRPLRDWNVVWHRREALPHPDLDRIEAFLLGCLIEDGQIRAFG